MIQCPGCGAPDDQSCRKGCPELIQKPTSKLHTIAEELIDLAYKKDRIYFNLVNDLLGQVKMCLQLEIQLNIPTVVKTLEESLAEHRKVSNSSKMPTLPE